MRISDWSSDVCSSDLIMQLPPDDEIVMIAGVPPVRAKKARYFTDRRFTARLLPAPKTQRSTTAPRPDDWTALAAPPRPVLADPTSADGSNHRPGKPAKPTSASQSDTANANIRREPGLPDHEEVVRETPTPRQEFAFDEIGRAQV